MNYDDKPQRITLVKSEHDRTLELVSLVVVWAAAYYVTYPEVADKIRTWLDNQWNRLVHRASIWRTKQDIIDLPETDESSRVSHVTPENRPHSVYCNCNVCIGAISSPFPSAPIKYEEDDD